MKVVEENVLSFNRYLYDLLKTERILSDLKKEKLKFPYDYRYILLKEDAIGEEMVQKILDLYTDEELDMLIYHLENNIYNCSFESQTRQENDVFNVTNDMKILKLCNVEYEKRF